MAVRIYGKIPEIPAGYYIDTKLRKAHFLAQIAHESGGFKWLKELWGPTAQQKKYEPPHPKAKELGNTEVGDGFKYRGRGYIQLTGRANYKDYSMRVFGDDRLIDAPDLAAIPVNAVRIAAEYWKANDLNHHADHDDIRKITKRINGGYTGLDDRIEWLNYFKGIIV